MCAVLSVRHTATMVGPPQNNVLLAVLPHELIQAPVAPSYRYSAQLNQTLFERFHISFVVPGSLLKVCFTEMGRSLSVMCITHTHTQISIA